MAELLRPEPLVAPATTRTDRHRDPEAAVDLLLSGETLLVFGNYRIGKTILDRLHARLAAPPGAPFAVRKQAEKTFQETAQRLLVQIANHRVNHSDAPQPGFLRMLYPDHRRFCLPLITVHDLDEAWKRFSTGVHFAALGHRLHPFYGTYLPTRSDHIALFGTWLSGYAGAKARCIDVGTGSGILALMLARSGAGHVLATDINPNAIESVRRELARIRPEPAITPRHTALLGEDTDPADLIVFNPPWIQGETRSLLDQALYFSGDLFERFFAQAAARLAPDGRVVVVFSNVVTLLTPDVLHPVEAELARDRFVLDQKLHRRAKRTGKRRTRERVEVWVLRARTPQDAATG